MVYYWSNKTPAAPAGSRNVTFQSDGGSPEKRSAHVGPAGAGVPGVIQLPDPLDGTKYLNGNGSWSTPSGGGGGGGGLVLLYSVDPLGVSSVDVTSVLSSLYFEYLIRLSGIASSAGETGINMVVSSDNGATWDNGAHYSWVREYQSAGNSGYENHFNSGTFFRMCGCPPSGLGRGQSDVMLYNPQMSGGCSIKAEAFNQGGDNRLYWDHIIGRYISTATINALKIFLSSGNYSSGSIRVYGYQR